MQQPTKSHAFSDVDGSTGTGNGAARVVECGRGVVGLWQQQWQWLSKLGGEVTGM
jgi:hypothetical protein